MGWVPLAIWAPLSAECHDIGRANVPMTQRLGLKIVKGTQQLPPATAATVATGKVAMATRSLTMSDWLKLNWDIHRYTEEIYWDADMMTAPAAYKIHQDPSTKLRPTDRYWISLAMLETAPLPTAAKTPSHSLGVGHLTNTSCCKRFPMVSKYFQRLICSLLSHAQETPRSPKKCQAAKPLQSSTERKVLVAAGSWRAPHVVTKPWVSHEYPMSQPKF